MFSHHQHCANKFAHLKRGMQTFSFIHKTNKKGPIIDIQAVSYEAAMKKLEYHVANATEWHRYKAAEPKAVEATK